MKEKTLKVCLSSFSSTKEYRFLRRGEEIGIKQQEAVERYFQKKGKVIKVKEALTKIQVVGLWTSKKEVEEGLQQLKSAMVKRDALKL